MYAAKYFATESPWDLDLSAQPTFALARLIKIGKAADVPVAPVA
jgi:hypothetical protein